MTPLLTVAEAAHLARTSRKRIRALLKSGDLTGDTSQPGRLLVSVVSFCERFQVSAESVYQCLAELQGRRASSSERSSRRSRVRVSPARKSRARRHPGVGGKQSCGNRRHGAVATDDPPSPVPFDTTTANDSLATTEFVRDMNRAFEKEGLQALDEGVRSGW